MNTIAADAMVSTKEKKNPMPFFAQDENGKVGLNWARLFELAVIVLATLWSNYQLINYRLEQMDKKIQQSVHTLERIERDFYRPVYEHDGKKNK